MRNINRRIALTVAACAFAAAGALFSGTTGLTQIKIVKTVPLSSATPVKIGLSAAELELAALNKKIDALAKQNIDLQQQINDLRAHVQEVNQGAIFLKPPSIQDQLNILDKKIGGLDKKLGSHTHGLTFDAMNLPTLGCKTCAFQPLVLTYSKSHDRTGAPIFK